MLTGALNLVNCEYGPAAPGLRRLFICNSSAMVAFAAVAGSIIGAKPGQQILVIGLVGGATLLSISKRSLLPVTRSGT